MNKKISVVAIVAFGLAASLGIVRTGHTAGKPAAEVKIVPDDIGGVVTSSKGPEAGVWVIAETKDLPTGYRKIVVTDDQGRYVIPELPKATYDVWVRGYGLVDSPKVKAAPGKMLNLTAVIAADPKEAAQYYPAAYWYSLLHIPPKSDFPGTGDKGNGISERIKDQGAWVENVKTDGCEACHQLGDKATRTIPSTLGAFDSSYAAWDRRIQSAQVGSQMSAIATRMGRKRMISEYADWTDRIKNGELPPAPPRPQGMERNLVITQWDWATPKEYFHDEISVDRRNPSSNPNGLIYGVHEDSSDYITVLDPNKNSFSQIKIPYNPGTPMAEPEELLEPSPYWGNEPVAISHATAHSLMMDSKGRIWTAAATRAPENPAYCQKGSPLESAMVLPIKTSSRQTNVYDPKTGKWELVDMCTSSQHLMFAEDANNTLWFSNPGGDNVGWLNTKMWDETHDAEKSQGWTPFVLDTNGNGKRDEYTEPGQPMDPTKDMRIKVGYYGLNSSPADGSIWGTVLGFPGGIVRLNPGPDPARTSLAEIYEVPWNNPKASVQGFSPRGMDITRDGVVWTVLASGHFASFDRRKCKGPLNGPTATGQHCPEGWTLYRTPGPSFKGTDGYGSADTNYYNWVDQFDTFGMGKNIPIATANGTDALEALDPKTGKFLVMRVPYPMGFFAKSMDGRIDDPKAGWKGRGLWSTYATRTPWHLEGGKGTTSKAVKFQLRPDPLAN
ncbi:MAG TPA: carboxypeptidase-like regulatory domain-containing protein [Candidatus Acidoferrales bacterium]